MVCSLEFIFTILLLDFSSFWSVFTILILLLKFKEETLLFNETSPASAEHMQSLSSSYINCQIFAISFI